MRFEDPTPLDTGAALPNDSRGVDPQRVDRDAMAAYSSNPGFREGISLADAHPLTQAVVVILAKKHPRSFSALEESPIELIGGSDEAILRVSELKRHIARESQPDLVKQAGNVISSLRKQKSKGSAQPQSTRAGRRRHRANVDLSHAMAALREGDASEEAMPEQERKAREVAYNQQFEASVTKLQEQAPHLDFTNFLELSEHLRLRERTSGLGAQERKGFAEQLRPRVAGYLSNPDTLVNDLEVLLLAGGNPLRVAHGEQAAEDGTSAYAEAVLSGIIASLPSLHYTSTELTPEITAKWLELAANLPPMSDSTTKEISDFCREDNESFSARGLAGVYGRRILLQTLTQITDQEPQQLIGSMYMLAEQGLYPTTPTSEQSVTGDVLNRLLTTKREAGQILYMSTGTTDPVLRLKAADLYMTLDYLGFPRMDLEGYSTWDTATNQPDVATAAELRQREKSRKNVGSTVFTALNTGIGGQVARELKRHARPNSGHQPTLYGRFWGHNEAVARREQHIEALKRNPLNRLLDSLWPKRS
ncbi:MAG TPA: hypothetical protein VIJ68_03940 [Candidatus Saccharimonadales bacterium]